MPLPKAQSICDPWPIKKIRQRKEISLFKKRESGFHERSARRDVDATRWREKAVPQHLHVCSPEKSEGNLILKLKYFGLEHQGMLPGHPCVSTLLDDLNGVYHGGASKVFITATIPYRMPSTNFSMD
jgi:hypothetical protein